MPLSKTIQTFTTYPILDTAFVARVNAAIPQLLALLPSTITYSPRNNFTVELPEKLKNDLVDTLPFYSVVCLVSVCAPNSTIPFHTDSDRLISLNFPIQNTSGLTLIHSETAPAANEITTVSTTAPDGSSISYPIAENFVPSNPITSSGDTPTMANIGMFYSVNNSTANPAVILSFRILHADEQKAFDYFAAL